jgi:hypothetical protein
LFLAEGEFNIPFYFNSQEYRVERNKEANRHQAETEEPEAAAVLTQEYLAVVLPPVLEGLKEAGYFIDDAKVGMS